MNMEATVSFDDCCPIVLSLLFNKIQDQIKCNFIIYQIGKLLDVLILYVDHQASYKNNK
jgi:hypothetical protein